MDLKNIPQTIRTFIENKVEVKNLAMPYFFADLSDFNKIQEGYRYSHPPGKDVIDFTGNKDGDWQPCWYVIAQNGMGDPFFIDSKEETADFPVYYSEHEAGRWDAYKVADNITEFTEILKKFAELENDKKAVLAFLAENTDMDNPLWAEVYVSIEED